MQQIFVCIDFVSYNLNKLKSQVNQTWISSGLPSLPSAISVCCFLTLKRQVLLLQLMSTFVLIAWILQCLRAPSSVILMLPKLLWMLYVNVFLGKEHTWWLKKSVANGEGKYFFQQILAFLLYAHYCVRSWTYKPVLHTSGHLTEGRSWEGS